MEVSIALRILAFGYEDEARPTVLLDVQVAPENLAHAEAIMEGGPVTVEDRAFDWTELPPFAGLQIWDGFVDMCESGRFYFRGRWECPTVDDLSQLGHVPRGMFHG